MSGWMWSLGYVIIGVVVLLPVLWLLASLTQNLWIPALVLGIALIVYLLGQLLHGLQVNANFHGANSTATLSQTVDALELELLKAEWREIKEQLAGDAEISGGRLAEAMATLKNFSRMDAKVKEVRDVMSMLEHNHSNTLEEILLRQLKKGQELADFAVERLAERITQQDFWERLAPQLLAAGVVQHVDAETLVRLETEKAKAQEELRIDRGIPQSLETIRVQGWIQLYDAMAKDFDQALPYRAGVFLAVCAGFFVLALLYHLLKRRLTIPTLVDETSVSWMRLPKALPSISEVFAGDHRMDRPKVVLCDKVRHSVEDMALVALKRSRRDLALPNAVFFGPPGTGKSLTARRLAESCGMDYAILSGGNVLGLKEDAVPELRRVFAWAQRSLRGLLIFIDEAEAFLSCRSNQSNAYVQAALSFFLAQTGSSSSRFQLILATNRVQDLDAAVLSRVPLRIEFGRPDSELLEQQVQDRMECLEPMAGQRLSQLLKDKGESQTVGQALHSWGFSGRDVQGLFEEFARRWSLEQELGRKADKEWLDRWFHHRALT